VKRVRWIWKASAILLCLIGAGDIVVNAAKPHVSLAHWAASAGLALSAIGAVQYAFGQPSMPRLLWRMFGPLFSLVMIWPLASAIGWLVTRLAIKRLTFAEQVGTAAMLTLLALYGVAVVVPLYRLGEWSKSKGEPNQHLASLSDTFA